MPHTPARPQTPYSRVELGRLPSWLHMQTWPIFVFCGFRVSPSQVNRGHGYQKGQSKTRLRGQKGWWCLSGGGRFEGDKRKRFWGITKNKKCKEIRTWEMNRKDMEMEVIRPINVRAKE